MINQEIAGFFCMIFAVAGVILNNRKLSACFYLWIISNTISAVLHFETGLYSLVLRDIIFIALAFEGIWHWRK